MWEPIVRTTKRPYAEPAPSRLQHGSRSEEPHDLIPPGRNTPGASFVASSRNAWKLKTSGSSIGLE